MPNLASCSEVDAPNAQDPPVVEATWPTFSGNPDESVADLIQSIYRHAFEQDRSTDDRWIGTYVGTCLSGDAMLWYCNLDDKTRHNWNKLRKALVTRFGPKPPMPVYPPLSGLVQQPGPVADILQAERMRALQLAQQAAGTAQARERLPNELRGRVEVFVPEQNLLLGFLAHSFQSTGTTISIAGNKLSSVLVSFVPDQDGNPVQLRVEGANPDVFYPYIGLALNDSLLPAQGQPLSVPMAMNPGGYPNPLYYSGQQISSLLQFGQSPVTIAQNAMQQQLTPQQPFARPQNAAHSWTMKPCTEINLDSVYQDERYRRAAKTTNLWEKASAAVWQYDTGTRELGVAWMNDDGTEDQLAIYVQGPVSNAGNIRMILYRTQDNAGETPNLGQGPAFQNIPVKLFFAPED
ncbi:hypothetical protein FS837_000862 [Tulasnella sp. UAMH 9824]|nr:hypothetical protein FS837_000862 [Tulasnella sp. UAMH 9824]